MTSQQILLFIFIAIVANAVLIGIALVTMVSSRRRAGKAQELAGREGPTPSPTIAGAGAPSPVSAEMATASSGDAIDPALPSAGAPDPGDGDEGGEPEGAALALLDPATGLESPAAWRRALDDEIVRLTRYHRPATVMLVELDGFDRLVDRLGAPAGARIVLATARTLRAEARAADRCARMGRGRFAVLLPETDEVMAINFIERVRSECDRWLESGEVTLRLAIGWAILDPNAGAATALQEADLRLDVDRRQRISSAT